MDVKNLAAKNVHYLAILVGFMLIAFLYFSPLLTGKSLPQMDDLHAKAMANELATHLEKTGQDAHWTNSMFGGMPAYQIKGGASYSVFLYMNRLLRFGLPYSTVALVFLYLLGFFVLLKSLQVNTWVSLAASAAFAFASYNIIIIGAGHITKAYAIAFMAPALAGAILLYRGKYALGALLALLGIGLEVASNHPQIAYYLMLILFTLFVSEFVIALRAKAWAVFVRASLWMALVGILGILPNATTLWTTYEYSKDSIRGGSPLSEDTRGQGGLDKSYALQWSYGLAETGTMLIPNFMGGSSTEGFDQDSDTYRVLAQNGHPNPEQIARYVAYWGDMPFTSGPVYFGAFVMFFFVLGIFIVENRYRWWILAATLLSVLLSWGRHAESITDFFFYYLPLYSKFRTVSMALVMANVTVVLLAALALKVLLEGNYNRNEAKRYATISLGIVGGFAALFVLFPGVVFDFKSLNDPANFPDWLMNKIYSDREGLLRADAFRSLAFVGLAFALAWLLIEQRIKNSIFGIALLVLVLVDMWPVAKRYLNESHFVKSSAAKAHFQKTPADIEILKDNDPNYRVLNLSRNPWNDAYTSYYHKSIGGYHGAKLSRYQDLIERQLSRNNMQVLNMLNTKYIITADENTGELRVNPNYQALGHAWFVPTVKQVEGAKAEMEALNDFDPAQVAVVDKSFEAQLGQLGDVVERDPAAHITLQSYAPDHLAYACKNSREQLAVFSEIYYNKGWNVYIDDKPTEYLRANYVLRALRIPAGEHRIEWRFEPKSVQYGNWVAMSSSALVLLLIGFFGWRVSQETQETPAQRKNK